MVIVCLSIISAGNSSARLYPSAPTEFVFIVADDERNEPIYTHHISAADVYY